MIFFQDMPHILGMVKREDLLLIINMIYIPGEKTWLKRHRMKLNMDGGLE